MPHHLTVLFSFIHIHIHFIVSEKVRNITIQTEEVQIQQEQAKAHRAYRRPVPKFNCGWVKITATFTRLVLEREKKSKINAVGTPVERMAFLIWGQVNPISRSGVAISIVEQWPVGGDGERARTGPAVQEHITVC